MTTRDLVLAALFAAIIVALGLVPPIMLGFIPVPITAQSLGVMLAGVILGAKRGGFAVLLVLLLVAIGLPVLSGGRGGLATFASPTAGYLVGWFFAAVVTGFRSERFVDRSQSGLVQITGFSLRPCSAAWSSTMRSVSPTSPMSPEPVLRPPLSATFPSFRAMC